MLRSNPQEKKRTKNILPLNIWGKLFVSGKNLFGSKLDQSRCENIEIKNQWKFFSFVNKKLNESFLSKIKAKSFVNQEDVARHHQHRSPCPAAAEIVKFHNNIIYNSAKTVNGKFLSIA